MRVGFPIRTSADQRSLASPRGFSQRATSFIASWRQGIHRTPLSRSRSTNTARAQDQTTPHASNAVNTHAQLTLYSTQPPGHTAQGPLFNQIPDAIVNEQANPARTKAPAQVNGLMKHTSRKGHHQPAKLAGDPPEGFPKASASGHGGDRIRTDDPLLAKQVLYQLSYAPKRYPLTGTSPEDHRLPRQGRSPLASQQPAPPFLQGIYLAARGSNINGPGRT